MQRERIIAVAIGGALGAGLRWFLLESVASYEFPIETLLANLIACFLLGVLIARGSRDVVSFGLATGFCGGLSTMSTFAVEAAELLRYDQIATLVAYLTASLVGGYISLQAGRSVR